MCDHITNDFNTALMHAVAKRIVRMSASDPAAARADWQQAVSAMDASEAAEFEAAIVRYAMEGSG